MSHSKIYFLILSLAFCIASTALAADSDDSKYRYLRPLSTNLKPGDVKDSDEPEITIARDIIREEREELDDDDHDFKVFLKHSKAGMEHLRNSKRIMEEVEREVLKKRHHEAKELKKFLAEIDRERRKHIVEIEREQRKLIQEIERQYRKNLKKID